MRYSLNLNFVKPFEDSHFYELDELVVKSYPDNLNSDEDRTTKTYTQNPSGLYQVSENLNGHNISTEDRFFEQSHILRIIENLSRQKLDSVYIRNDGGLIKHSRGSECKTTLDEIDKAFYDITGESLNNLLENYKLEYTKSKNSFLFSTTEQPNNNPDNLYTSPYSILLNLGVDGKIKRLKIISKIEDGDELLGYNTQDYELNYKGKYNFEHYESDDKGIIKNANPDPNYISTNLTEKNILQNLVNYKTPYKTTFHIEDTLIAEETHHAAKLLENILMGLQDLDNSRFKKYLEDTLLKHLETLDLTEKPDQNHFITQLYGILSGLNIEKSK